MREVLDATVGQVVEDDQSLGEIAIAPPKLSDVLADPDLLVSQQYYGTEHKSELKVNERSAQIASNEAITLVNELVNRWTDDAHALPFKNGHDSEALQAAKLEIADRLRDIGVLSVDEEVRSISIAWKGSQSNAFDSESVDSLAIIVRTDRGIANFANLADPEGGMECKRAIWIEKDELAFITPDMKAMLERRINQFAAVGFNRIDEKALDALSGLIKAEADNYNEKIKYLNQDFRLELTDSALKVRRQDGKEFTYSFGSTSGTEQNKPLSIDKISVQRPGESKSYRLN